MAAARTSLPRTTPRPRRRDEAKALFRNAILDAAEEAFSQHGFHATRIHDVAKRAGMAVGTIYNHFGQKEDVLRALIEERTADMLRVISPLRSDPRSFEDRLAARLERLFEHVAKHKNFYSLAVEHGLLGGATSAARQLLGKKRIEHMARFRAVLRKLVDEGIRENAIAPLDPDLLVRLLGSAMRAIVMQTIEGATYPSDVAARTVATFFLRGAGAVRTGTRR